ncbi:MAG TPA: FAD-binding protein [Gaiellaceae bacterium]|nr:FAD-binding protein [Gaiellaceae bacterium]
MPGTGAVPKLQIVYPESPGWDEARQAWNLAVGQRPEAVVYAEAVADVVAAVELARARGWRVAAQGTGHGAAPMGALEGTLLLKTERMRGVAVDPAAWIARVEAGALWQDVVEAAAPHGLAALAGSSPDVGVVGYTLGGGLGWLGRLHGLAANSVVAAELVTADGRAVRVDHVHEPDVFWALRGGGGSFGVVTALELRLFPLDEVYAGILWWPIERARDVLQAWRKLTARSLPDELTTVGRLLRLPPLPEIPAEIRGGSFVVVEAIYAGAPAEAELLLAPLRALRPTRAALRTTPLTELSRLHMDPEHPVPAGGDGMLLTDLPAEAVNALVRVAGAQSESSLLSVEIRHLGGELARRRPDNGVLASVDAGYAVYAVGMAPTPVLAAVTDEHVGVVLEALAPWAAPGMVANFAETARDPAAIWGEHVYQRLRRVKKAVDPTDLIRANHPVIPARG